MPTEIVLSNNKMIIPELTETDAEVIAKYVSEVKDCCYLEIGTMKGGSAIVAKKANPEAEIHSVDPLADLSDWKGSKELNTINFINKTSLDAAREWDKPIDVLFIDGDHCCAAQDYGAWEKFLHKGSVVLFHDYAPHSQKVISDCVYGILRDPKYKPLYVPVQEPRDNTSILQARKL